MQLRILQSTDHANWQQLWQAYQGFYQVAFNPELAQRTFSRLLDPQSGMGCQVIEHEQQLVALVHYVFHPSTWTPEDYCYLQDLFVSPAYRAQGLGRQLIEAVYSVAETQKCSRVYWLTHESNTSARSLYDQVADHVGFIQYRKNLIP